MVKHRCRDRKAFSTKTGMVNVDINQTNFDFLGKRFVLIFSHPTRPGWKLPNDLALSLANTGRILGVILTFMVILHYEFNTVELAVRDKPVSAVK